MINKRSVVIVTSSAAIALIGDLATYSLGASKGGKFRIAFPKGKELLAFISLGIISGILVDFVVNRMEKALLPEQELALKKLVKKESEKVIKGEVSGEIEPKKILWSKKTS